MSRIAPGGRRDVGTLVWAFSHAAGLRARTRPPRIFLVLGRHRRLFAGWLHFAGRLMPGGLLPRRESELVIVRVAHLCDSAYELQHHTRLGRAAGLSGADLERLSTGPDAEGWTPRERALLRATDLLHAERDLDDATWEELSEHLDERERIELCMLVGHYTMLATVIRALRIEPDPPRRRKGSAAGPSPAPGARPARRPARRPAPRPPAS
ncbi:MAG: carboxymuconolactone decarboxylase family protein [Actinoallomurus sp.]